MIRLDFQPLAVYSGMHTSPRRERLLVGGFGSGKSMALCYDAIVRGLQMPGARILLSRFTVPELRDTLEPSFMDVLPTELFQQSEVRRAGGHIESITFPNGTKYLFRSMDDWQKYKSYNLALWYHDELSELPETFYTGLKARTRQVELTSEARAMGYTHTIPDGYRGVCAATNPDGHSWIWRRWVEKPAAETAYWVGTSLDNPHLPEDYLRTLLDMPEAWVKRYVLSDWDEFGGLVYPAFSHDRHVVRPPALPKRAEVWHAYDPGTRHPGAMLWAYVQPPYVTIYHEEQARGRPVADWVRKIREVEKDLPRPTWRVADPNSIHVRDRGTMMSLHAQYGRYGYHFQNGPAHHRDRIPMLGTLIEQGRLLISEDCPRTIDQISHYRWEDLTPAQHRKLGEHAETYGPERPVKADDDFVDCAQYLSSKWVRLPSQLKKKNAADYPTSWAATSADLREGIRRRQRERVESAGVDINVPV